LDRNRVSYENNPSVSVGVASMSPALSLTTNVLPSRIWTWLMWLVPFFDVFDMPAAAATGGPGMTRWNATSSVMSPSIDS
jgi:hypothetical protein